MPCEVGRLNPVFLYLQIRHFECGFVFAVSESGATASGTVVARAHHVVYLGGITRAPNMDTWPCCAPAMCHVSFIENTLYKSV